MDDAIPDSSRNPLLRCERCWSYEEVQLFQFTATGQMFRADDETGVPLCRECRVRAPRDPLVFKEIFLRFVSPKELMSAYSASTEEEAIEKLCRERHLDFENMMNRIGGSRMVRNSESESIGRFPGNLIHLGGPFGYHYDDAGLVVNETEARIVKDIFDSYLSGAGIAKICRDLNKRGVKTRRGRSWASQTIANILSNPVYCGFARMSGELVPVSHKRLVSSETFNRVQEEMQRRIRRPDQKTENCLILPREKGKAGES